MLFVEDGGASGGGGGGSEVELSGQVTSPLTALPGPVPTTVAAQDSFVVFVAPNGSDTTGNGNEFNPYATLTHAGAQAVARGASESQPFVVAASPGTYTENLALLPYVAYQGISDDWNNFVIDGNLSVDPSWGTVSGAPVGFLTNGVAFGTHSLDLAAAGVSGATLAGIYAFQFSFEGNLTVTGNGLNHVLVLKNSLMQGEATAFVAVSVASFQSLFLDTRIAASGTPTTGQAEWVSSGDAFANFGWSTSLTVDATLGATSFVGQGTALGQAVGLVLIGADSSYVNTIEGAGTSLTQTGGAPAPVFVGSGSYPSGYVPTADGAGNIAWQAPSGGGVTWADDLAGSTDTNQFVVQLTGSGGIVDVVSGTDLDFLTTGHATSATGRLNFIADVAQIYMAAHYSGVDMALVRTDGGEDFYFGSSASGAENFFQGGFAAVLTQVAAANSLEIIGSGATLNSTAFTVDSTPTTFDAGSHVKIEAYELFAPFAAPATPPNPMLWATGDETGTGNAIFHTSDQGMQTQLAPAGNSERPFILRASVELLFVTAGGTSTASLELIPECVHEVLVTVLGVGNTGSDGFRETGTATVRVTSGGVAAFVSTAIGSTNPTINPLLDQTSDGSFNAVSGGPSSFTIGVSGESVTVTVTNAGVVTNSFNVFFEVKGYAVT